MVTLQSIKPKSQGELYAIDSEQVYAFEKAATIIEWFSKDVLRLFDSPYKK